MKRWWTIQPAVFFATAFLAAATLHTAPAAAGPWRDLRAAQGQQDRQDRGAQRRRDAGPPERFQRQERPQRLSDEERRELHRDLDKARREIYKPRRER